MVSCKGRAYKEKVYQYVDNVILSEKFFVIVHKIGKGKVDIDSFNYFFFFLVLLLIST